MVNPVARGVAHTLLFGAACLLRVAPAVGFTASLSGHVTDPEGDVVVGAMIELTSSETGFGRTSSTSDTGSFFFLGLSPGSYNLTVAATGFLTESRDDLVLTVGQSAVLDVALRLPVVADSLDVSARGHMIEPGKTALGTTISTSEIDDLPVEGRTFGDFLGLSRLAAGVLVDTNPNRAIATAGQTGLDNSFRLDGLSFDDALNGVVRGTISLDSIGEIAILTNGYNAEYGQASGLVVDVVTRSGGSRLAGRFLALFQDDRLNAASFTAGSADPPTSKTDLGQTILSGYVGGPLARNRVFYFLSAEYADRSTEYVNASPVIEVFRPVDPLVLPVERHSTTAMARIDATAGQANLLTGRIRVYSDDGLNGLKENLSAAERGRDIFDDVFDLAVFYSRLSGSTAINELRAQVARRDLEYNVDRYCPGCYAENRPSVLLGKPSNAPQQRRETQWQVTDSYSRVLPRPRGQHRIKAGVDLSLVDEESYFPLDLDGTFLFATDMPFAADDPATYPRRFTQNLGDPGVRLDDRVVSLFIQDEWSLRSRWTFNVGLRWDYEQTPGVEPDRDNLAPRVGIAFSPDPGGRSIVRASAGLFFSQIHLAVARDAAVGLVRSVIDNPGYPDPLGPNPNPRPPLGEAPPSTTIFSDDLYIPFTRQVLLGAQHRFGSATVVSSDLVWARGVDMLAGHDLNYPDLDDPLRPRPDPELGPIIATESLGRSTYTGLQLGVQQQSARRFRYTLAYTLSQSKRDTEGFRFFPQDQRDYDADFGPADNDARHLLVASAALNLPARIELTGLIRARSALPYNITTGRDDNRDSFFTDRPPGVGRNSERGSSFQQLDLRLVKAIAVGPYEIDLIVESFNVLNRRNWLDYQGNLRSESFGQPTSTAPARTVQLGMRIDFQQP